MLPIFKQLSEYSQFLCLERIDERYYIFGIQDRATKYSDTWQIKKINLNKKHQHSDKVDISQQIREFNKYFISLISYLKTFDSQLQNLKSIIYKYDNNSIFEYMVENKLIEQSQNSESNLDESYSQDDEDNIQYQNQCDINSYEQQNSGNEMNTELDKIIENYEELLLLLLISNDDFQISFKNPLVLNYKDLKVLKLKQIHLQIEELIYTQWYYPRQKRNCEQLDIIKNISKKEGLKLYSQHLVVDVNLKLTCNCDCCNCWNDDVDDINISIYLPEIKSSYIYLNISLKHKKGLKDFQSIIEFNKFLFNDRCRLLIKKYQIMSLYYEEDYFVKISSICEKYDSFIISSNKNIQQMNKVELFLEESILLMMNAMFKQQIHQKLKNNITMVFTDLLIN